MITNSFILINWGGGGWGVNSDLMIRFHLGNRLLMVCIKTVFKNLPNRDYLIKNMGIFSFYIYW